MLDVLIATRWHRLPTLCALTCLPLLTACPEGSGGGNGTPTNTSITVNGVVATGAAVAGATVNAKCSTGTGSATTAADGRYAMPLSTAAALPCVLEVSTADGTKLHSLAVGGSTNADGSTTLAANVTPATELVVAEVVGKDPAEAFSAFDSIAAAAVTGARVATAETKVVATLKAAGVDLSAAGSLITGALAAANGSTSGNVYDQALDALARALNSSGSTITEMAQAVAASSTTSVTPPATNLNTLLPADLQALPSAANCSALRSTTYRVVRPRYSDVTQESTQFTMDARTLKFTDLRDNNTDTWVANGDCRYIGALSDPHPSEIVVTQAGVLVGRTWDDVTLKYSQAFAFPEQAHTVAELAGDWNMMGRDLSSGTSAADALYGGVSGNWTVSAAGVVSNINYCHLATCAAVTGKNISYSLNPTVTPTTGGFALTNSTDGWVSRTYAYKAGGGEMMLVDVSGDGSLNFWTKKADGTLPKVDSIQLAWGLPSDTTAVAGKFSDAQFVNGAASGNGFVRVSQIDGHTETLQINTPRSGYTFRAAGTASNSAGASVNVSEFTALGMRGMGLSVLWIPSLGTAGGLWFSPQKPTNTGTASLSPDLLGQGYAPTCAALRSGTYRIVHLHNGSAEILTSVLTAPTLTWGSSTGPTWVASATETCHFNDAGTGLNDIVVSQAGVITARVNDTANNARWVWMAIPEQAHTLADLAGNWNVLGLKRNSAGTGYNGMSATVTANASGVRTSGSWCMNEATRGLLASDCQALTAADLTSFAVDAGGGFLASDGGRLFQYRSGTGVMNLTVGTNGGFRVETPVAKIMPTVGRVNVTWDLSMNSLTDANAAVSTSSHTNAAFDANNGQLTRVSNDDGHTEVLMLNNPRDGYIYRAPIVAAATTIPVAGTVPVREFSALFLRSAMGINVQWRPQMMADQVANNALARFQVSVQTP